ncbi:MAG TPA: hypothetical protein VKA46_27780 [Gemmataceae bacterium]|nr:hypothetical protein [Gemmataceae bacterium]
MIPEEALLPAAQTYEAEGYRVLVRPTGDQLPSFVGGYPVDLIATQGDERVIVQVKETREDLAKDRDLIRLVEAATQGGWRVDLMVLGATDPLAKIENGAELRRDQIEEQLRHAETMAEVGELLVSCVLAWSALEATMRRTARNAGLKIKTTAPTFLIRSLYSQGLLSREEFDRLDETMRYRTGAVHGLSVPGLTAAVPAAAIEVARRLLAEELNVQGA